MNKAGQAGRGKCVSNGAEPGSNGVGRHFRHDYRPCNAQCLVYKIPMKPQIPVRGDAKRGS